MSFDKIFDLTAGVYFNFYNIIRSKVWSKTVSIQCMCQVCVIVLSHLTLVKTRVRGHTKVLEPLEDPKNQVKPKFVQEILRFLA